LTSVSVSRQSEFLGVGEVTGAKVGDFVGDDVGVFVGEDVGVFVGVPVGLVVGVAPSQMSIVPVKPNLPSPLNVTPFRVTEYDPNPSAQQIPSP
jgi:hypothetical protein